ncbi:MAG: alginate export family protein [Polaromonas sp.]
MNFRALASLLVLAAVLIDSTARAQLVAPATPPEPNGLRIDERRSEQPLTVNAFGRPVQLSGSWEYTDELRNNFNLDRTRARNRRVREHEVKLEARTRPSNDTEIFLRAVGLDESRRTQGSAGTEENQSLERGQAWIKVERLGGTPWAVQAGRVPLIDRRAWWWDEDLDAVRLLHAGDKWQLDTGLAREVARVSSAEHGIASKARGVTRWFGQATWHLAPRHSIDAFWLHARDGSAQPTPGSLAASEDDADPSDLSARWHGLRASGEWRFGKGPRLAYWLDTAVLRGSERLTRYTERDDGQLTAGSTTTRRVRGQALDLGATLVLPVALRPSITLGYARGSGGERSATLDNNFRQTGLQENKARLAGVKRLRRYGELLRPELSNLAVTTLGVGVRVLKHSSIELVAHRYRQPVPSTEITGARLSTDPLGANGDIGHELDLAIVLREWRHTDLSLKWSRFKPGAAFASNRRDPANAVELGLTINF